VWVFRRPAPIGDVRGMDAGWDALRGEGAKGCVNYMAIAVGSIWNIASRYWSLT
jgi:hypothetical protein